MSKRAKKEGCIVCGSVIVKSGQICDKCDPKKIKRELLFSYKEAFEAAFIVDFEDYIYDTCEFSLGSFSKDMELGGRLRDKVVEDYGEEAFRILYDLARVSIGKSKQKYKEGL